MCIREKRRRKEEGNGIRPVQQAFLGPVPEKEPPVIIPLLQCVERPPIICWHEKEGKEGNKKNRNQNVPFHL